MERKLAAIFSTDVKGYSRLMGDDEEATIHTLKTYRDVITRLIEQYHGRVVDSPGDNMLAEFASAVDAVKAAVAIQHELQTRNAELEDHRRMEFRIGLNVGDVITDEGRLYGDGVNIAARLESLAEGGGISISGTVYDQVKNKLALGYEYRGEQAVKNIAEPVRVYRVQMEPGAAAPGVSREKRVEPRHWQRAALAVVTLLLVGAGAVVIRNLYLTPSPPPVAVPSEETPALPLPDKPSIAVLPFTNMSGDPEQEYFSDGITEDIITDLSKIAGLFVIARNSAFTYKNKAVNVQDVGRELGVRHLLEGSVRKAGPRIRITAQLIDATTGNHVWAERYDRQLEDIFDLQDEIRQKIVFALKVTLTPEEQTRFRRAPTVSLEAYDAYLRGVEMMWRMTSEANGSARELFSEAIQLDPNYAAAYAQLGFAYWITWITQWTDDPPTAMKQAAEQAKRALVLDDQLALGHRIIGVVSVFQRQYAQARRSTERAIELDPNDAEHLVMYAAVLTFSGQPHEALTALERGRRLNPHTPYIHSYFLGVTRLVLGEYDLAVQALESVVSRVPTFQPAYIFLVVSYAEQQEMEEARARAAAIKRLNPQFSGDLWAQQIPFHDPTYRTHLRDILREVELQ